MNEDDEQVEVEFRVRGLDAAYEAIDTNLSSGKRLKGDQNATSTLKMAQDIVRRDWVFLKWFSSKNGQQKPYFSITSLDFDTVSGEIVSG